MEDMSGTQTSVHVGANNRDYEKMFDRGDPHTTRVHAGSGSAISFLSNRVSWFFNLLGPSMSLDTGCPVAPWASIMPAKAFGMGIPKW